MIWTGTRKRDLSKIVMVMDGNQTPLSIAHYLTDMGSAIQILDASEIGYIERDWMTPEIYMSHGVQKSDTFEV